MDEKNAHLWFLIPVAKSPSREIELISTLRPGFESSWLFQFFARIGFSPSV